MTATRPRSWPTRATTRYDAIRASRACLRRSAVCIVRHREFGVAAAQRECCLTSVPFVAWRSALVMLHELTRRYCAKDATSWRAARNSPRRAGMTEQQEQEIT